MRSIKTVEKLLSKQNGDPDRDVRGFQQPSEPTPRQKQAERKKKNSPRPATA